MEWIVSLRFYILCPIILNFLAWFKYSNVKTLKGWLAAQRRLTCNARWFFPLVLWPEEGPTSHIHAFPTWFPVASVTHHHKHGLKQRKRLEAIFMRCASLGCSQGVGRARPPPGPRVMGRGAYRPSPMPGNGCIPCLWPLSLQSLPLSHCLFSAWEFSLLQGHMWLHLGSTQMVQRRLPISRFLI